MEIEDHIASDDKEKATPSLDKTESEDDGDKRQPCSICLIDLDDQDIGAPEECVHKFCLECILEWCKTVTTCPLDRQPVSTIRAYHGMAAKVPFRCIPVKEPKEESSTRPSEQDIGCEVCGRTTMAHRLLLCDGCNLGYHCACLNPPLRSVPRTRYWYCPPCTRAREEQAAGPRVHRIYGERFSQRVLQRMMSSGNVEIVTEPEAEASEPRSRPRNTSSAPRRRRSSSSPRRSRRGRRRNGRRRRTRPYIAPVYRTFYGEESEAEESDDEMEISEPAARPMVPRTPQPPPNFLDNILRSQTVLHTNSSDLVIGPDGSLSTKEQDSSSQPQQGVTSVAAQQVPSSAPGPQLPSICSSSVSPPASSAVLAPSLLSTAPCVAPAMSCVAQSTAAVSWSMPTSTLAVSYPPVLRHISSSTPPSALSYVTESAAVVSWSMPTSTSAVSYPPVPSPLPSSATPSALSYVTQSAAAVSWSMPISTLAVSYPPVPSPLPTSAPYSTVSHVTQSASAVSWGMPTSTQAPLYTSPLAIPIPLPVPPPSPKAASDVSPSTSSKTEAASTTTTNKYLLNKAIDCVKTILRPYFKNHKLSAELYQRILKHSVGRIMSKGVFDKTKIMKLVGDYLKKHNVQ